MVSGLTWMTKRRWPPRGRFSGKIAAARCDALKRVGSCAAQTKGSFPAIPDEAGTLRGRPMVPASTT